MTYTLHQGSDGRTMLGSSTLMHWSLLGESAGITVTGLTHMVVTPVHTRVLVLQQVMCWIMQSYVCTKIHYGLGNSNLNSRLSFCDFVANFYATAFSLV